MTTRLLHLVASPRGARSRSGAVAAHLIGQMTDMTVETLDLFTASLPEFDGAVIDARYALINGETVPAAAEADWRSIEQRIAHFLSFDAWLISTPMWNFGIPYRLKQYIDLITQPGLAFSVSAEGAVEGRAKGTAIILAAGAMDTTPGSPLAHMDFQAAYLETWLRFIGVSSIHTLRIQPTYGSAETVEVAMQAAFAEADALAAAL